MTQANASTLSIFDLLRDQIGDELPIVRCTKATLVHLSHLLEDMVLSEELPAMIFTGFQESSHWRKETARYEALSKTVRHTCVFAGRPLPPETNASQLHVQLRDEDPLRQEWFLLVLSERFSALLCGKDNVKPVSQEALREFDTIWTFDPEMIDRVLDVLEQVIADYRPEKYETLRQARREYTLREPDTHLVTRFSLEMIGFEERLQNDLMRQKRLTDTLLTSIQHHLYSGSIDSDGVVNLSYNSPNLARILGVEVLPTRSPKQIMPLHIYPEDRPVYERHMVRLRDGESTQSEYRIVRDDRQIIWIQDAVQVTRSTDDDRITFYGVANDITEQKNLEAERREQERLRLEVEKQRDVLTMKNYFMTTVSHEFRTPLATILSASEMLSRYADRMSADDRSQRLDNIREQVLHLGRMLDDISTIINDEVDRLGFHPRQTDVIDLFHELIGEFEIAHGVEDRVVLKVETELTPIQVDPTLIRQMVVNLLTNAHKYSSSQEQILITLRLYDGRLVFSVADRGIGIPKTDQSRIFEPFHRGSNIDGISGAGLGLKIVWDCVQLHDGTINYQSQEKQGTVFTISLPILPPGERS